MNMIYPKKINPGDQVCLIDPANAFTQEAVEAASGYLQGKGLKVVVSEDMAFKRGTARERAEKLNKVVRNPENKGIFCVWGGYGTMPLLDLIDYTAFAENRPVFCGYSDNTALHMAIAQKTGLVTFHGPSFYSPTRPTSEEAKEYLVDMLMNFRGGHGRSEEKEIWWKLRNFNGEQFQAICEGECQGQLTGGNLTLISRLMGTAYEIDTRDKVLFFEEIGEKPYRIHGMLTQLKMAGKLSQAAGIIVGALNDCDNEERPGTGMEAVREVLSDIDIPVVCGVRAGHVGDALTLPLNSVVRIEGKDVFI